MTRHPVAAITAIVLIASAAGCAARPAADAGTAPPGHTLRVGLMEWRIVTSGRAVAAGLDHLTVTNTGTTAHNLYVIGDDVHAHTATLAPGRTATLTITTRAGATLSLTCEIPGHEEAGMRASVAVVDPQPSVSAAPRGVTG